MGWVGYRKAGSFVTVVWIGMIVVPVIGYVIYSIVTYKPTEIIMGPSAPPSASAKR